MGVAPQDASYHSFVRFVENGWGMSLLVCRVMTYKVIQLSPPTIINMVRYYATWHSWISR